MFRLSRLVMGFLISGAALPAMAYDCTDYLRWNLQERIKHIERRLGYYKFNPSYFTNVPSGWPEVQYHTEKLCLRDDYKSKNLDDVLEEASIKEGMRKS